jgi:hypothetical protein
MARMRTLLTSSTLLAMLCWAGCASLEEEWKKEKKAWKESWTNPKPITLDADYIIDQLSQESTNQTEKERLRRRR